jgi:hypothetical protein
MSLFLYYFDGSDLSDLHGLNGAATLYPVSTTVRLKGQTLATEIISVSDGVASDRLRDGTSQVGQVLRLSLIALLFRRLLEGASPCFFFHIAHDAEGPIALGSRLDISITDLVVRIARNADAPAPAGGVLPPTSSTARTFAEGETWSLADLLESIPEDVLIRVSPLHGSSPRGSPQTHRGRRR